jgi:hypothetical protein
MFDCEKYVRPPAFISKVSAGVWELINEGPTKSEGALYVEVEEPLLALVPLSSLLKYLAKDHYHFLDIFGQKPEITFLDPLPQQSSL